MIEQLSKSHILCIEDDAETSELITIMLERAGYRVTCVPELDEGRAKIAAEKFDLMILDFVFPDRSGIELCREIRQTDKTTPIIFHSAAAQEAEISNALAAGANDYLVKPRGWTRLIELVGTLLANR